MRNNHCGDAPANIDNGISISDDNGLTWSSPKRTIQLPGNSATMDSSIVEDRETGTVLIGLTVYPENYGYPNNRKGAGFEDFNGERCLVLYDGDQAGNGNKYYLKKDGNVYDASNKLSGYTIDEDYNLIKNGQNVGNIFMANCPLKLLGTAYLGLI